MACALISEPMPISSGCISQLTVVQSGTSLTRGHPE
jgi:hypothetical protein